MRYYDKSDYLAHFGILGMKWGVRRYQNPDGSLTTEGQKRYGVSGKTKENKIRKIDRRFGADKNRSEVRQRIAMDMHKSQTLKARYNDWTKARRALTDEYVRLYNKHAPSGARLDPNDFLIEFTDPDIDMQVWDDDNFGKNPLHEKEHEARAQYMAEHDRIVQSYIQEYANASIDDIPNDGSEEARQLIRSYTNTNLRSLSVDVENELEYPYWVYDPFDM